MPADPEHLAVRQELANVLAGKPFATAARSRRFLSYVTEKTLAGEHDAIKELILGIEVFDRPSDFDPRNDTIVRVEAGKLRKRLQEHYENGGLASPLRIEIPKGTYVPRFLTTADETAAKQRPATEQAAAAPPTRPLAPPQGNGRRRLFFFSIAGMALGFALAFSLYPRLTPTAPDPIVAVLPFLNFSADPANEYFADGLTEDLTDVLARTRNFRVVSRTSAFFFKGKQPDLREVADKLHAAYVVEGSVRRDGPRIKVTAQIIRTADGIHLWSNSFERDFKDVFAVQQEIAQAVTSVLEQKLNRAAAKSKPRSYTANPQAFDLYMRGRHAASAPFLTDIDEAEKLQLAAITADSAYPLPHLALAELYLRADILGLRPSAELYTKAKASLASALALDNTLAGAHAAMGSLAARHEYDWAAAEAHLREALDLDPNSAVAHNALAHDVLAPQQRWDEAFAENRKSLELDPFSAQFAIGTPWLEYLKRDYDAALAHLEQLAKTPLSSPMVSLTIATTRMAKGDFAPALAILSADPGPHAPAMLLGLAAYIQGRSGHRDAAERALARMTAESKRRYISAGPFALAYIGVNQPSRAFDALEAARIAHESFLIFARIEPLLDSLRPDPRFPKLLESIGLTDAAISKNQELSKRIHR